MKMPIVDSSSLFIFTDASASQKEGKYTSCSGAIAVVAKSTDDYEIIDEKFLLNRTSRKDNGEIRAINLGIRLGIKHKAEFNNFYLFSDSKVSIWGLREKIGQWVENSTGSKLVGSTNFPISNQQDILSCIYDIMVNQLHIGLYHQLGHCEYSEYMIHKALERFQCNNSIEGHVSEEFIRFICNMNCYTDHKSRSILMNNMQNRRHKILVNEDELIKYVYKPFNVAYYLSLVRN